MTFTEAASCKQKEKGEEKGGNRGIGQGKPSKACRKSHTDIVGRQGNTQSKKTLEGRGIGGSFFGKKYMHVFWVASEKSEEDGDRLGDTAALPLLYEMGYWAKIADRLFGNGNSISDWNFGIQNYQQALDALIWGVDVNTLAKRAGMVIEERMRKLDPGFSLANRPTRVKAEVAGTWKNFIPLPSMVSDQPVVEKAMPTITVERSY